MAPSADNLAPSADGGKEDSEEEENVTMPIPLASRLRVLSAALDEAGAMSFEAVAPPALVYTEREFSPKPAAPPSKAEAPAVQPSVRSRRSRSTVTTVETTTTMKAPVGPPI